MEIEKLINLKSEIEDYYFKEINRRKDEVMKLQTEIKLLENEKSERLDPINSELISVMKSFNFKKIETESGVTVNLKTFDATKISNWSTALDKMAKTSMVEQLQKTHPKYIRIEQSEVLDIQGIKQAIKDGELNLAPDGSVVDLNGELLGDKPIFKLKNDELKIG